MIEDILYGITRKLGIFKCHVYIDEIKNNLITPSFYVNLITSNFTRYPSNRFNHDLPFEVIYFPSSNNNYNVEIYNIITELNYQLEIIELENGQLLKGLNMSHEIVNGVLHFYVTYNVFTRLSKSDLDYMLNLNGGVGIIE